MNIYVSAVIIIKFKIIYLLKKKIINYPKHNV